MNIEQALHELSKNNDGHGNYSKENCNHSSNAISFNSDQSYSSVSICPMCLKELIREKTTKKGWL